MSSYETADLVIIGAGPAGSAAAIDATRQGRRVILIDKATFPRDKCCGDGLTTDALRIVEDLGLDPRTVPNWNSVTDIVIRAPRGRTITLPLPDGPGQFAAVVPRADFDHALVQLAAAAGTDVREGTAVEQVSQLDDRVIVETSRGAPIHSHYAIAADGMWSPTRKLLGLDVAGYRGEWHAFRQYFTNTGPQSQHLNVWFEPDLLPGYAWSFPLPGQRANVGFGILRGAGIAIGDMGRVWRELLERPHISEVLGPDARPEGAHKAWPIPAHIGLLPLSSGRVLFTGDAIGATDPMTGEGIAQALESGRLAVEAVGAAGPRHPERAADRYEAAIERRIGRDHRFARRLGSLLGNERIADAAIGAAGLTGWTRRNFARWMFEDYPRAAILTPDRWHRGMFTGPGAFRASSSPVPDHEDLAAAHERPVSRP